MQAVFGAHFERFVGVREAGLGVSAQLCQLGGEEQRHAQAEGVAQLPRV
jgi:hypothetical protein